MELDALSEGERDRLWADLDAGLSYDRAVLLLAKEHFAVIKRHRLFTWWHREDQRRALNAYLPLGQRLAAAEFLDLLNGQALPWSELMHGRILRAAFLLSGEEEEQTPAKLLSLQRIANNEFHQEIVREKLELEKRRQNLRELQARAKGLSVPRPADVAQPDAVEGAEGVDGVDGVDLCGVAASPGPKGESDGNDGRNESDDDGGVTIGNKPFRMWTPEELAVKQPRVQAIIRAHPFLSQFVRPMTELPPDQLPPIAAEYPQEQGSGEVGDVGDLGDVRAAIQEAIE